MLLLSMLIIFSLQEYSPPVQVDAPNLKEVSTEVPLTFALFFDNNARNVQIGLPPGVGLNISVTWGKNLD